MPEIVWREHVRNANLYQHPEGCGYTNQARFSGLKLLKPGSAGFVCVATPFRVSATKLTCSLVWKSLLLTPAALCAALTFCSTAIATETPGSRDSLNQVTSVSQLTDVDPTHWAFQALQSLVERYGCIEGYPDRTYRGNRALTRYEFAAGLNACLDRIQELIAAAVADLPSRDDIATIRRLQEEFAAELATLRGRVDALEARTARLEANQFSTTTKLRGEVIFALAGAFGDEKANSQDDIEDNITLSHRTRLNFDTSFSGKDQLRVRLQGRNTTPLSGDVTGTNMTRLSFDGNEENDVRIDDMYYRFPLGKQTTVWVIANAYGSENIADPLNPLLRSDGSGSISRFGRFSPIYRLAEGPGIALNHQFSNAVNLTVAYRARNANTPSDKAGLFDGNYGALAQLTLTPNKNIGVALTYVNSYFPGSGVDTSGSTGSAFARRPFDQVATFTHSYGLESTFRLSQNFTLSGWLGLTQAEAKAGANKGNDATIFNWAVTFGFPDLGKKGNLAGFVVGMPPKVTDNDINTREDQDTSLHLEAFYRIQATNNISITPGVIVITNPEHNDSNNTIYVGTVRTTFSF